MVQGSIGFVKGDLYHIWHGDIDKRQYLKRIQDFTAKTKQIVHRDKNGLFITNECDDTYMENYFKQREVSHDDNFLTSTLLGAALGEIIIDEMIVDVPNSNDEPKQEFQGFGGGDFGGGGAGGSWDSEEKAETTPNTENLNTESQLGAFS